MGWLEEWLETLKDKPPCYGDYDPEHNPCEGCEWRGECKDISWEVEGDDY